MVSHWVLSFGMFRGATLISEPVWAFWVHSSPFFPWCLSAYFFRVPSLVSRLPPLCILYTLRMNRIVAVPKRLAIVGQRRGMAGRFPELDVSKSYNVEVCALVVLYYLVCAIISPGTLSCCTHSRVFACRPSRFRSLPSASRSSGRTNTRHGHSTRTLPALLC